ncbi:MAG: hypothetical protein JKY48_15270 [Flavobacteriales bacterium]|nr:hypothetical protein [Flavobacteriales bacterium]
MNYSEQELETALLEQLAVFKDMPMNSPEVLHAKSLFQEIFEEGAITVAEFSRINAAMQP